MPRKYANYYQKKDGTWQLRFTVDGKRYAVYGKTRDECRIKEDQKRKEIEEHAYQRQRDITLRQYAERWLQAKEGTVKSSTVLSYTTQVHAINADPIADVLIRDLRPQHIRDLIDRRRDKVGVRSVNLVLVTLKQILRSAQQDKLITWNPSDEIKALRAPRRRPEENKHRALTKEETAAFLRAADARDDTYRDLYRLMLHTGLRIGEAIALEDGDVSEDRISVSRTIIRDGGSCVMGDSPKTESGIRTVPLDGEALAAIRSAKARRKAYGAETPRIFCSRTGGLLYTQHVNDSIRETCKKAGIDPPFTSHALRDTFATRCAEAQMQPRVLMEIMGHSNISVTMQIYVHVMDESKTAQLLAVDFGT